MRILITNDDGIHSKALQVLAERLSHLGSVVVAAPQQEQSGVGHAFSYYRTLRYGPADGYSCEAYWINGTPADCVKFAICELMKERLPDLVISGVNAGENAGVSVIYSGTLAGAREGALWKIPSIALSLQEMKPEFLEPCLQWVCRVVRDRLFAEIPPRVFWSVNFPAVVEPRGLQVCPMSTVMFIDEYMPQVNPRGIREFWLTGFKDRPELSQGTDDWWLAQGYATLTPLQVDQTAFQELTRLRALQTELQPADKDNPCLNPN